MIIIFIIFPVRHHLIHSTDFSFPFLINFQSNLQSHLRFLFVTIKNIHTCSLLNKINTQIYSPLFPSLRNRIFLVLEKSRAKNEGIKKWNASSSTVSIRIKCNFKTTGLSLVCGRTPSVSIVKNRKSIPMYGLFSLW